MFMNKAYDRFKRKIFILRHAKAEIGQGLRDFDRPLAQRGIQDAQALGGYLQDHGWLPDLIITSPALRTKQTMQNLQAPLDQKISYEENQTIYDGHRGDLLEIINKASDGYERIMMVGHNPDIHGIAALLTIPEANTEYHKLQTMYKTCTLSILGTNAESWADVTPQSCELLEYIRL